MEPEHFISVSGISRFDQLKSICAVCFEEDLNLPLVIGFQLSYRSINQGNPGARQPKFEEMGDLARATHSYGFKPAIHYYTKNNETILNDLEKIINRGVLEGFPAIFQLNTLPPPLDIIRQIKESGFEIAFKVPVVNKETPEQGYAIWKGDHVQDVKKGNVSSLVDLVRAYANYIDYAMFDPSHGVNLGLDLGENSLAIRFGKEVRNHKDLDNLGLIYAGGINPNNIGLIIKRLFSYFPKGVSIDTESGVRDVVKDGKNVVKDELNINLVRQSQVNYSQAIRNP